MIAAIVLAAGRGSRYDGVKQLHPVAGRAMLERVVATVASAALDDLVVVLGARAEQVREAVELGESRVVVCPNWADGQAASLRCGLDAAGARDRRRHGGAGRRPRSDAGRDRAAAGGTRAATAGRAGSRLRRRTVAPGGAAPRCLAASFPPTVRLRAGRLSGRRSTAPTSTRREISTTRPDRSSAAAAGRPARRRRVLAATGLDRGPQVSLEHVPVVAVAALTQVDVDRRDFLLGQSAIEIRLKHVLSSATGLSAPGIGAHVVGSCAGARSASACLSRRRPRYRRDMTVPIGTPRIPAASA